MLTAETTMTATPPTDWVKRLLAAEGAFDNGAETAMAAGRVYEKLNDQLVPLLGTPGVRAIFVRSAKLAQAQGPGLCGVAAFESARSLSAGIQAIEPAVARGVLEGLFSTFIRLMPTFIGERLTRDALSRAWPHLCEQ